ncbi:MAG: DAK2 domain-containing protein [Oscillospiraceae bacterium]|nr:DAK2 domain-containing protein [Oscillospiraceae bacterium]
MSIRRINGFQLEHMLRNALANLQNNEAELNRLNVFPVADGDTGTNMSLTLYNGVAAAQSKAEAGLYLRELSEGMLLGARGNSGVILSQIFRGIALELARCTVIGPGELRNALVRGYRTAYEAVIQPVEGTILTVAREGIEHIRGQVGRGTGIDTLLSMYTAEMRKTLSYTPEMLSVLKDAGVVDSGALGYILICEGMLKYLYGETLHAHTPVRAGASEPAAGSPDPSLFNENSSFEDGYCLEFILQLMRRPGYVQHFRLPPFIEDLKSYGGSLVAIQDGTRVKVHIHTHKPAKIIALAQQYGEFISFKLDNMQMQHNEHIRAAASAPEQPLAIVAVASGEGIAQCYRELGCSAVIDGGASMNPSAQSFLDAFRGLRAACIAVLPNHVNAIPAAEQAASLFGGARIEVIPSRSLAEGYYALAMDVPDSPDTDYRLRCLRSGVEQVVTLGITTAAHAYANSGLSCRAGDLIVLRDKDLLAVGEDASLCLKAALEKLPFIEDKESAVLFRGSGITRDEEDALIGALSERLPCAEICALDGGQSLYRWLIGLS